MKMSAELAEAITDPLAYAQWERSHAAFAELRASMPVALAEAEGVDPFWAITRYEDIKTVELAQDLFHNGDRAAVLTTQRDDEKIREMTGGSPHLVRALVMMDPPEHGAYRKLTQGWFMSANLERIEARIREIARETVQRMLARDGACDFAQDVALLYPLRVIMEVMGLPPSDEPKMLRLTQELFGATDPELSRDAAVYERGDDLASLINDVVSEFFGYFTALTEDRRAAPRDDLSSAIATGAVNGAPLGHLEAMSYYVLIATAGHDTTSACTASAAWALAERPDQLQRLKADPSLIPGLVEESIRWETPVKHFMRTATADAALGGRKIAKGDWLMLCYPSGNRDEAVFAAPYDFDASRSPNKHLSFGYGPHLCLGQHLAKLEMRILWEELLPRIESLELAGVPRRAAANFVSGPKSVPVRFRAA